ncbi:MAG: hypothetical protein ACQEUN_16595 [Pseudomonadota bacterium]
MLWDRGAREGAGKEPKNWDIYFDHWSKWRVNLNKIEFSGIHAIRHPFSLIHSATLYHLKSKEKWLHVPRESFGGLTYFQKLSSLASFEEKLMFEMENHSKIVIEDMMSVAKDVRFYDVRLENISKDERMSDLAAAFDFCGVKNEELDDWLEIASEFCLWKMKDLPKHSTTGVGSSWQIDFKDEVLIRYRELFGYAEKELGY